MSTIDPELLMRYADNELSLLERRRVEDELRADPEAEALVAVFRDQRSQLPAALTMAGDDEGFRHLEQAIDSALQKRRRHRRQADFRRWSLPIAASLLITLIGGVLGIYYAEQRANTETTRLLAAQAVEQANDRELALETRIEALERALSGNTLTWTNDLSGTEGSITPLRTFRSPNGQWCREYREIITSPASQDEQLSIACRDTQKNWTAPLGTGAT